MPGHCQLAVGINNEMHLKAHNRVTAMEEILHRLQLADLGRSMASAI